MAVTLREKKDLTSTTLFVFLGQGIVQLTSNCTGYTSCNCIHRQSMSILKQIAVLRSQIHLSIDIHLTCQEQKDS